MESHFFAYLYRLRYIERWSLMRNVTKENVAEHSYHVSILTHALCSIANQVYDKQINTEKAVSYALFHDATEMFTGDIPTPVKHHNPEILQNFRVIEQQAAQRLISMVPEALQAVYRPLIESKQETARGAQIVEETSLEDKENAELRKYVKAADLLDAYLKCSSELSAGNQEFATAKRQIEASIKKLEMEETEYFLSHMTPSFNKSLDEMSDSK